jgi:hypothetical protein
MIATFNFLMMTNVRDQNQIKQFQSFNGYFLQKKNIHRRKLKKRKLIGKNCLFKPKMFDKFYVILKWYHIFLIDQFILNKIVGNGCEYEYSDTSKVHVQVRV